MNKVNTNENYNYFKGIAILIIIFTHIPPTTIPLIQTISNLGYIAVSIFFTISGSLLIKNFIEKDNYEKNFISKKIKRIYIPYIISNIIYIFIQLMFNKYKITFIKIIKDILGINTINPMSWYITNILLIYIVFFIIFIIFKKNKLIKNKFKKFLTIIILSYITYTIIKIICSSLNLNIFHLNELSLSLFLGMTLELIKQKNIKLPKKIKPLLIIIILTLHVLMKQISNSILKIYISQILIPVTVSMLLQYNFKKVICKKNLMKLGTYSLEIYLIHNSILSMCKYIFSNFNNNIIYISIYVITLLLTSYNFSKLTKKIINF